MPFTLIHMGAGLLGKGLAPKSQSLVLFGAIQVAIDIEPGVRMVSGHGELHGWSHNFFGMALIAAIAGYGFSRLAGVKLWRYTVPQMSRKYIIDTCFWAWITHWILDALCHTDMTPNFVQYAGIDTAHGMALVMAVFGIALLGMRFAIGGGLAGLKALRQRWLKKGK